MQEEKTSRQEFLKRMAVAAAAVVSVAGAAAAVNAEAEDRGTGEPHLYHEMAEWRKYYETLR